MVNRRFIDLNSKFIEIGVPRPFGKEPHDEFWQNDFRSTDGLHSFRLPISLLCRTLQRPLQSQKFFLLGPVSHFSVCSTHFSRKSQRYRSVSSNHAAKALSHGYSQHGVAQHSGQRQPSARLAHLRRFRSDPDSRSTFSVSGRILWARTRQYSLRARRHHHRSVSVAFSMGTVSPSQVRCQTAHSARSARQYPLGGDCYRRSGPRGQHPRPVDLGAGCRLPDGSWLSRLQKTLSHTTVGSLLCDSGEKKIRLSAAVLANHRQEDGLAMRSDRGAQQSGAQARLSGKTAAGALLRWSESKTFCVSDQQLSLAGFDDHRALSVSLESRTVFPLDQAASAHQGFLWHFGECSQNSSLDRDRRLRFGRHRQEEVA